MKGLVIRQPHIGKILAGEKTWEMRSRPTKVRGRIALIEAGSGMIVGECDIIRSFEAPTLPVMRHFTRGYHCLEEKDYHLMDKWKYAWQLENVIKYENPVPYQHPKGAVIWVNLKGGQE